VCAREDGIRRSKDLRAGIGKFPNSTNERKQMSNKTIFKRIALVAVTALGAGVLSSAPATALNNAGSLGQTNPVTAAGVLNIAGNNSITGAAALGSTGAGTSQTSVGLLAFNETQTTSSLTSTATLLSTGEATFYYTGVTAGAAQTVVVTGGKMENDASVGSSMVMNFNASRTNVVFGPNSAAATVLNFGVKPDSGATTMTVELYETAAALANNGSAADIASVQSGLTSKGTLKQKYTITVATAAASGTYSSTYSGVRGVTAATTLAAGSFTDQTASLSIDNSASSVAYIALDLRDAYNVSLDNIGALVISGTGGAGIYYAGSSAAGTPVNLTAVSNDTSGTITVARPAAAANKGFSTTVTVQWNGATIATKTVTFYGEIAKLTATADRMATAGLTTSANLLIGTVIAYDAAGNILYPSSGVGVTSATLNSKVTDVSVTDHPDSATGDTKADYAVTCAGTQSSGLSAGDAAITFTYTNPVSGNIITSNEVTVKCSGDAYTYAASFDKAVYAPGDVATLTITGKDGQGKLANYFEDISGSDATLISYAGGTGMTLVGAAPVNATAVQFTGTGASQGTYTVKFTVGSTEGKSNVVVSIPVINAKAKGGADVTVPYEVKSGTATVSNADVLKSIVALIASINKQIQALQKLILKR